MNPSQFIKPLTLAALLISPVVSAQIRVNDTWQDATRTDPAAPTYSENGIDGDSDGDLESVWYRSGTGSATTMSVGHMINAAGAAGSMSLTTYFSPSTVSLVNIGDQLRLTWVFTPQ